MIRSGLAGIALVVAIAAIGFVARGPAAAQSLAIDTVPATAGQPPDKRPKLDSQLAATARVQRERGAAAAADLARARRLDVVDQQVQVVIESPAAGRAGVRAAITASGGQLQAEYAGLIQARLPIGALEAIAARPDVGYVRPPYRMEFVAVTDEGVAASNASVWQSSGLTGSGVKLGIIDGGFAGYTARQASGDLPASLTAADFCGGQFQTATTHGTGVAEVAYKMAPGAQLFLICIDTEVTLGQAKDYAKAQGIQIVNHSVAWLNTSRGDGNGGPGTPDAIVADARANGILWVNAAGNYAQTHWSGTFSDADGNGFHNFAGTDEGNTITIAAGGTMCAFLKWDDWPVSAQDYDLWLFRSGDGLTLAASTNAQTGTQPPTEQFCYTNTTSSSQSAFLAIFKYSATTTPRFDLIVTGSTSNLGYQVPDGSLIEPASSPNAMAAGALCWQGDSLEPYSSRGPTIDGRIKPDIAGQDSVSSATFGSFTACGASGFAGTSAAAPHVAGAGALVKQANPSFGPAEIQSFLESRAVDLGPGGKDNAYGAGRLSLGPPPISPPTATPTPRSCPQRPQVSISVSPSGAGSVQVVVAANSNANAPNNLLRSLQFVTDSHVPNPNALIYIPGGPQGVAPPLAWPLPGVPTATFSLRQTSGAGAVTVPLVVVDDCGPWSTLVGAGPNAFGATAATAASGQSAGAAPSATPRATGTPMPPSPAPTATPTPAAVCTPRAQVSVATSALGDGRLQVTVGAPVAANDRLLALRFGAATNALIDVPGGPTGATGNLTVPLPPATSQTTFFIRRAAPNQATTVNLVVVDACGEWPTVVGGGPNAF